MRWKSNGAGYQTQTQFYEAIREYGWENIRHAILAEGLTREEADAMEARAVEECHANDPEHGYNVREGGFNAPLDPSSIEKIRQANTGKPCKEETKRKLREFNLGKRLSEETRAKIKATTTGMPKSKEHARHISEGRRGIPSKCRKPVMRIEDGAVFPSALHAARAMGFTGTATVSHCCTGRRKTAGGYHWRYVDDDSPDQRPS